jgi:type II secretory pathway component PulK
MTRLVAACRPRRGFALLAVLWVLVGVAALSLGGVLAGREAVDSARNRVNLVRAAWRAEACVERARAAIADTLAAREGAARGWEALDTIIHNSPLTAGCSVTATPTGVALDVNAATEEQLRALLLAIDVPGERADSIADAILDWRDADDISRKGGAERDWYVRNHRIPARNAPFVAREEIHHVRGLEELPRLDSLLDVDSSRIVTARAPVAVLAAIKATEVDGRMGPATTLFARFVEAPDAWVLTSRASSGDPAIEATLEVRLVRSASRAAIVRRRTWP